MKAHRLRATCLLVVCLPLVGCAAPWSEPASSGRSISVNGNAALQWGDGQYGVVLAHGASFDAASWEAQATAIAAQGATVVAVEDIGPDALEDAVLHLQAGGIDEVALVGGSAGSDAILQLATTNPTLPDQLVLLSPNQVVDGLGEEPKLFIASRGDPVADVSARLAESAPGEENELMLLSGSDHSQGIFDGPHGEEVLDAVLRRLRQFDGR